MIENNNLLKGIFIFVILLVLPIFVKADGWDATKPSHLTLYADTITSKTDSSAVNIADSQGLFVTGDVTTLGNVGIGTTGPGAKLHVQTSSTGYSWTPSAGTVAIFESADSSRAFVNIVGKSTAQSELWFSSDTIQSRGRVRYGHDTDYMSFWVGSTEKVRIDGTGNVGIGTTGPIAKLNVLSGASGTPSTLLGFNAATANAIPTMGKNPLLMLVGAGDANSGPNIGMFQVNIGGANVNQAASELYLGATRGTSASNRVAVANNDILGQIGFFGDDGTDVRSRGAVIQSVVDTSGEAVGTQVIPARLALVTSEKTPITFHTDAGAQRGGIGAITANERMRIDYLGNVGIGTTLPQQEFHVIGDIRASSLSGTGNAYACVNANGDIYRSVTACV